MDIPEELVSRLKGVPPKEQRREGIRISVETIQALKATDGVHGVHIMAIEWEDVVPQLVEEAGLFPRPGL
jgi:methylenetetrahydrofolate reductase (NADPH)